MTKAIVANQLGKRYRRFAIQRPQTMKDAIFRWRNWFSKTETFWGLRNLTFSVPCGCTLGVIGRNGAGKSTLLKLLGGIGRPDEGSLEVAGQINALLDLGAGFHPDLTGRENVYIAGLIAGLNRRQIKSHFSSIVEFAQLEAFIDSPLRTYSDGMKMRLAFSVATHTEPDVLLVDEVLAVGDNTFQERCLDRIREIRARGATIVVVSHSVGTVRELCDEVLLLRQGELAAFGPPELVVEAYLREAEEEARRSRESRGVGNPVVGNLKMGENRFGTLEAEIQRVRLISGDREVAAIAAGDALRVEIDYTIHDPSIVCIFGVSIVDAKGQTIVDLVMPNERPASFTNARTGTTSLEIERLDMGSGEYSINTGIFSPDFQQTFDYHWNNYPLTVSGAFARHGYLVPPARWLVTNSKA